MELNVFYIITGIITIISFIFGLYQGSQRKKLKGLNRSEAWSLYRKMAILLGKCQDSLISLEQGGSKDIAKTRETMVRIDEGLQNLVRDSIRLIQRSEPHFNHKIIQSWIDDNRIPTIHRADFEGLVAGTSGKIINN